MDLNIKNEKLIAHFEAEENGALYNRGMEAHCPSSGEEHAWIKEHPETILYGYLSSYLEICEMHEIEIDLTYDMVRNLAKGLAALFQFQKRHYELAKNVDIVAKTFATVLSYIAINEHGYWFRTTSYLKQVQTGKGPKQPLWADVLSITVGKKNRFADFLPVCKEAAVPGSILASSGFTLRIDGAVSEYKKLTGVDLAKYGLENLFVN